MFQYISANTTKICIYFCIAVPQNFYTQSLKFAISYRVGFLVFRLAMLNSVKLNYDSFACYEKINYIITYVFLPVYGYGKLF